MRAVPEVAKRLGLPRQTISRWIARGYITPAVPAEGPGSVVLLDERNEAPIAAVAAVVRVFGDGEAARTVIEQAFRLVTPGTRRLWATVEIAL
jgi:hypothetical protein